MKIPSNISYNKISLYGNSIAHGRKSENANADKLEAQNSKELDRPVLAARSNGSERLNKKNANQPSFTGDPKLIAHITQEAVNGFENGIPEWAKKMGGANWFKGALDSVNKNEAFFEAFIALFVAGVMKPACVLAMPGAEKEDKEMSATKNSVSALLGFGLSNLILSPCSDAVNKMTSSFKETDPSKMTKYVKDVEYIKKLKSEELLPGMKSTLGDSFKVVYKKFWDLGVSPLKAGLTIALTPVILKFLFGKDKKKSNKKVQQPVPLQSSSVYNAIRMEKNANKKVSFAGNNHSTDNNNNVSFTGLNPKAVTIAGEAATESLKNNAIEISANALKGVGGLLKKTGSMIGIAKRKYTDTLSEPIAKGMGAISDTKIARKLVEGTAHFEKPSPRWSDLTSVAITYFYISNTYKSEKIDEDRKLPLMINNAMVTLASSGAAFLIDKYTDKPMENLLKGYMAKHGDNMLEKAKCNIAKTFEAASEKGGFHDIHLDQMKHNADEILKDGVDKLAPHIKKAIKELENNNSIKEALDKNIIQNEDVAKMLVSGIESQASKVYKNISKAKSLTIFTITVRFLVTVLMTPIIGRVVAMVNKKLGKTKPENKKPEHYESKVKNPETLGIKDFMSMVKK